MNTSYFLLALAAGAALATQVALNSQLMVAVGTPMQATLISLGVGGSSPHSPTHSSPLSRCPGFASLAAAPWWVWCGGLLGVLYLWATVVASPKLGVAVTFGLVIAGQVVTSMVLDHSGLLNLPVYPASGQRVVGVVLVVACVVVMGLAK
jgi:bacterial/archaeal transporter family-2 protein